jgi:hypothetical protein
LREVCSALPPLQPPSTGVFRSHAGLFEVVTKLNSEGVEKARMRAPTLSGFGITGMAATRYQARRSAAVTLVAPSTFVMRFKLYAIVARPISTLAPDNPRISKRGCPKIRYLIVAKGCSTVHRRSLIACGVIRASIRFKASSYKWRAKPRLGASVHRGFSEQLPQSLAAALYWMKRSLGLVCLRSSFLLPGQR